MKAAASKEVFEEMKFIAEKIWRTYSDEFGYVTEKINSINSFENIKDNAMIFYRMFDHINQAMFRQVASEEVLKYIKNNK